METVVADVTQALVAARTHIAAHGHTKHRMHDGHGRVCAWGALCQTQTSSFSLGQISDAKVEWAETIDRLLRESHAEWHGEFDPDCTWNGASVWINNNLIRSKKQALAWFDRAIARSLR